MRTKRKLSRRSKNHVSLVKKSRRQKTRARRTNVRSTNARKKKNALRKMNKSI